MKPPVLNKKQNYALWQAGAFGNKLRAWRTVEEWQASGYGGQVAVRFLEGVSGFCFYDVNPCCVAGMVASLKEQGIAASGIMINEMAPRDAIILQGEYLNGVVQDGEGRALPNPFFYSRSPLHMRDALRADGQYTYGLRADLMLRDAMTPSSYEDWRVLLDQCPDHVIEVSIYDRCLGDIPGRNALVWEVRRY